MPCLLWLSAVTSPRDLFAQWSWQQVAPYPQAARLTSRASKPNPIFSLSTQLSVHTDPPTSFCLYWFLFWKSQSSAKPGEVWVQGEWMGCLMGISQGNLQAWYSSSGCGLPFFQMNHRSVVCDCVYPPCPPSPALSCLGPCSKNSGLAMCTKQLLLWQAFTTALSVPSILGHYVHSSAVLYSDPVTEHTIMSILQKSTLKGLWECSNSHNWPKDSTQALWPLKPTFLPATPPCLFWWPVGISIMSSRAMRSEELNITEGPAMPGRG